MIVGFAEALSHWQLVGVRALLREVKKSVSPYSGRRNWKRVLRPSRADRGEPKLRRQVLLCQMGCNPRTQLVAINAFLQEHQHGRAGAAESDSVNPVCPG